ncbi:MAG: copper chaperone PCu(A)C [Spirochaetota bacterium]|nr:copper chaperone PCu(A)C [Spirochaetota bacterium]
MTKKILLSIMALAIMTAVMACDSKNKASGAQKKPSGPPAEKKAETLKPLMIVKPWIRLRPPGMKVTGGFVKLENPNNSPVKLISAESDICEATELHEMIHEKNVMKMKKVDSIEVPANGTMDLKPGGYHLMFINLKKPLKADQKVTVKFSYEKGLSQTVTFNVKNNLMKKPAHKMKMDHGK